MRRKPGLAALKPPIIVLSGGALDVAAGGTAANAIWLPGGSVSSRPGASLTYTTNAAGPPATVYTSGYTGTVETYTVQQSGPVTITVEGAAGAAGKGSAGGAGAEVTGMPCFAAGTRILGIDGEILVEDIKPGGPARDRPGG